MDYGLMYRTLPFFIKGAGVTISITVLSTLVGISLGIIVAVGRVRGGNSHLKLPQDMLQLLGEHHYWSKYLLSTLD